MDDYREIFNKEVEKLNYLYVKANTKSKKKNLAYDLIFFEDMYNALSDDKIIFPWTNDEFFMEVRNEVINNLVQNILNDQYFLIDLVESSFNIFLECEFSVHKDYGKKYHKMSESMMQKSIVGLYNEIDENLKYRFMNKFDNLEIFVNNTIERYAGLFFPVESISKNIIFITANDVMSVEEGRILAHEMGHDYEFETAMKNGGNSIWNGIVRTIYPEVSSSFFEYAYINYLIDNNLYREDAIILKRRYLNQIYYFLSYLLIIFNHKNLNIDSEFNITLEDKEIIDYANSLLDMMNSSDERYESGDKLNFRSPFVYGIGKLLGIYVYDFYKNNPKEFLDKFKTSILEYKDTGLDAFRCLGITYDSLIEGKVLKRTIKECK